MKISYLNSNLFRCTSISWIHVGEWVSEWAMLLKFGQPFPDILVISFAYLLGISFAYPAYPPPQIMTNVLNMFSIFLQPPNISILLEYHQKYDKHWRILRLKFQIESILDHNQFIQSAILVIWIFQRLTSGKFSFSNITTYIEYGGWEW